MFLKKYFVSYWYQLEHSEQHLGDGLIQCNMKINKDEHLSKVRQKIKEGIEKETGRFCNCVVIISIQKV